MNETLLTYLKEHNTGEKYSFAAMDYGTAGPYIIDEGGIGCDSERVQQFRCALYDRHPEGASRERQKRNISSLPAAVWAADGGGNSEITTWITETGTEVPSADWQGTVTGSNAGTLYEITLD